MREVIYWGIGMVMGANLGVLIMSLFKASDTSTNKNGDVGNGKQQNNSARHKL